MQLDVFTWIFTESIRLTMRGITLQTKPTLKTVMCFQRLSELLNVFQSCRSRQPWGMVSRSEPIARCKILQEQNENKKFKTNLRFKLWTNEFRNNLFDYLDRNKFGFDYCCCFCFNFLKMLCLCLCITPVIRSSICEL